MRADRRPHPTALTLSTTVPKIDRPKKKFAEIAMQILGKAVLCVRKDAFLA
jgi:hypothetical protein